MAILVDKITDLIGETPLMRWQISLRIRRDMSSASSRLGIPAPVSKTGLVFL
jgi:hypothetical protein